ncbi:zinc finger SWIM domain-containing protein 8 [Aplysia californica]|uniref:Zinc finger SWIM domain-containing protein 8 n=1 Tax=Aplysia californica TaxID=6500 RepID=A0ABM1VSU7_APLCA|nr:zinc finger SWIM domain-containing protein 8 [Aplysia californica]
MDLMFEWEYEGDRFSFEDSDRFEEDSLCSWGSEPESVCNNWRGWKRQNGGPNVGAGRERQVSPLAELSAKAVACHIPFEVVERFPEPIPEPVQLRIAFWSFPESEEDIRLYSCLANGSADEFTKGEHLYKNKSVKDTLQIGFHLSGTVVTVQNVAQGQSKGSFNVAVVFDRRRISGCTCTCGSSASWCAHIVALCLFRIKEASSVCLRAPVSESLSRLHRDQLQKFAQYLISELPQQILPTAQQILDELLSSQETAMNTEYGAPDPTAGPSASEQTSWSLDESALHENIKKTLVKFCIPSPMVFSDVNYLTASAPPAATEWQSLLRPLRGREPEGMWNLLSIVREMFRRHDSNSVPLLEILTDEVLQCEQILIWWFITKVSPCNNATVIHCSRSGNTANATQNAASSLCDEIVTLWRLATLNPKLSPNQRQDMLAKFRDWHISTIEKVRKFRNNSSNNAASGLKKGDIENFPGFKPAIEACALTWEDYPIPGITYSAKDSSRFYYHFGSNKPHDSDCKKPSRVQPVTICSQDIISTDNPSRNLAHSQRSQEVRGSRGRPADPRPSHPSRRDSGHDGAMSSGSEGFCEPERGFRDSDSSGDYKGNPSRSNSFEEVDSLHSYAPKSSSIPALSKVAVSSSSPLSNSQLLIAARQPSLEIDVFDESIADLDGGIGDIAPNVNPKNPSNMLPALGAYAYPPPNCQPVSHSMAAAANAAAAATAPSSSSSMFVSSLQSSSGSTPPAELAVNAVAKQGPPENPEAQQSSDEYQIYYYDTKAKVTDADKKKKEKADEPNVFAGLKSAENMQDDDSDSDTDSECDTEMEILFARAEALHAHGHTKDASRLAQRLAEEMLSNPPDLLADSASAPSPKSKKKKALTNISMFASALLSKASFLSSVLCEDEECHHLAFKIGIFGMELARPPASNKAIEVKLAHQETELLQLLKKIPLGVKEMKEIRFRAERLRDGALKSRGEALLPLSLATFIFETLCVPACLAYTPDEKLGFEAAVTALGMKANIAEADHPLLCESTRRQRGELAIAMLVHYKDDQVKLSKIMEKLLDKEVHQQYKAPSLLTYLSGHKQPCSSHGAAVSQSGSQRSSESGSSSGYRSQGGGRADLYYNLVVRERNGAAGTRSESRTERGLWREDRPDSGTSTDNTATPVGASASSTPNGGARPKTNFSLRYNSGKDTDSSAMEEEDDLKALEAKIRCMGMKKKPSQGMASIDSSAPETTSSDNSPTLIRRNFAKHQGPGSDSGSSGESDSLGSSSSGDKGVRAQARDNESPPSPYLNRMLLPQALMDSRGQVSGKNIRYKGRQRIMPTVPNQPSEAGYHFMFELAKTVLQKAGGTSSTSLFTQPSSNTGHTGPHRNLHLCAFQIGLYALGLSNCVAPNWLSRTYSSHVSWITGQATEIGSAAIRMIVDTWEGHLTPPEAASLADRASRGGDPTMVRVAAELALSCLPHAHALNPTEVQRALYQCKEQSRDMLEKACLAVETAAEGGGVFPEVLFEVARHWYELSEEASQNSPDSMDSSDGSSHTLRGRRESGSPASHASTDPGSSSSDRTSPSSGPKSNHYSTVAGVAVHSSQSPAHSQQQVASPVSSSPQLIPSSTPHLPPQTVVLVPAHSAGPPPLGAHYVQPYNYVQPVTTATPPPGAFSHHQFPHSPSGQHSHHAIHSHNLHPHTAYVASYTYPTQASFTSLPPNMYHTGNAPHLRALPPVQVFSSQPHPAMHAMHPVEVVTTSPPSGNPSPVQNSTVAVPQVQPCTHNQLQLNYLMAAFRTGMLAMETLSRRVHDDRPQTKYARNPPYGEDVKWLLSSVAIKLGTTFLQQFCASAVNAVVSPFILYDLAMEAARFLARNNPTHVPTQLRSNILNSLFQKCLQMFIQCALQRIHHINNADYDEFVSIVCNARNAFYLAPGGIVQFNELLQSLRRSKSCRKDLWQRIVNGLASGSV